MSTASGLLTEIWTALGGDPADLVRVEITGTRALRSAFPVTDLAAASFAAAGLALAELAATVAPAGDPPAGVRVDRELAGGWFYLPIGPSVPVVPTPPRRTTPGANPWMTEFRTADDRWLRVQMMFPRLRRRVLERLGADETVESVAAAIRRLGAEQAEQLLIDAGAAVAVSRSLQEWREHPQGRAVAAEPIVAIGEGGSPRRRWRPTPGRPLAGLKVLDLTRVVAGPMATRFLAACGAEVLRLEAPGSDESVVFGAGSDLVLGKRWAYLDIDEPEGRARFLELLAEADVLVHGYRPGAVDRLVSPEQRAAVQPGLVEVVFTAYGWTGPWAGRRGFDSLVQYSSGLAAETQAWALEDPDRRVPINALGKLVTADRPRHLPVEAIDFSTGYQVAAAAIAGLTRLVTTGRGSVSRLSLARTATLLADAGRAVDEPELHLPLSGPLDDTIHATPHGPVRRLRFPVEVDGAPLYWERPYEPVGSSVARWTAAAPP